MACQGFKTTKNVPKIGHLATADVVDRSGSRLHGGEGGLNTVCYKGAAAQLVSIAMDYQRLVLEQGLNEAVVGLVGPLAWTVN